MIRKFIYITTIHFLTIMTLAAIVACSSEETSIDNSEENGTFVVTAEVAQQVYLRNYKGSGRVESGIYYLSYPQTDNITYNVASVDFAKEDGTPGIGVVTVPENKELKWESVGGGSTPTFYLDNVKPELADDNSSSTEIILNDKNPYKAGIFDQEEGSNDLLWGTEIASRNDKNIKFDLHHNMSRVRVQITVDHTNELETGDIDLKNAKVYITSLVHKPISYNRLDGSLSLGDDPLYDSLTFVDPDIKAQSWAKIETIPEKPLVEIYTTEDFVLPPQDLLEDERRPHLTIELENGRIYSGILPHAMEVGDKDNNHTEPSYPVALSFLKEHILTIRTIITEDPPELAFMPVWVVQWVDKGDFTIEAHQAGIYTKQEFGKLIEYYQANNEYQLTRYGRLVDDSDSPTNEQKWIFDFFHSIELDYNTIHGAMKRTNGQKDFSFSFNNYTQYIIKDSNSPQPISESKLYNIVTGVE